MQRQQIDWLVFSIAIVAATWVPSSTWERVKTRPKDRTIEVTGSAKRRIVSDLIGWSATVETHDADRVAAYRMLRDHVEKAVGYLTSHGIQADEIRVSSATMNEVFETEVSGAGDERIEHQVSKGFTGTQTITVRSADVAAVEQVSREVTQLLEQGVSVTSGSPEYFYTKLGELKIEMLAEASQDARTRADNMVSSAGGGRISALRSADMGVINVNPPNSTSTSWDGNNDTTSYEKDIITIVHATFELADE